MLGVFDRCWVTPKKVKAKNTIGFKLKKSLGFDCLHQVVLKMECLSWQGNEKGLPGWVTKFVNLSHLMITLSCSSNFYIYLVKYGGRKALNKRQLVFKFKLKRSFMSPASETSPPQLSCFNNSLPPTTTAATQPQSGAIRRGFIFEQQTLEPCHLPNVTGHHRGLFGYATII